VFVNSSYFVAPELSAIMSLAERLKKQTAQVYALTAEKEDIVAQKEVIHLFMNF
jgi:hypothetical protein